MRRKRRKRNYYPKWRSLKEGDVVWLQNHSYVEKEPILLVERVHHKKKRAYSDGMVYWYDGVFLSLTTGKLMTRKLSNAMTYAEVTRAPRLPEPEEDIEEYIEE